MNKKLNDKYRVVTDTYQYTLFKLTGAVDKEGKEVRQAVGHYGTIEHTIKGLLEHEIKTSELEDIKELQRHIDKVGSDIVTTLRETTDIPLRGL